MIAAAGLAIGLALITSRLGVVGAAAFVAAVAIGIPVLLWVLDR